MGFRHQVIHQKKQAHRRGQSLLEFALILPILLFIVFGVLDLGRAFFAVITITNASREGARYGVLHPADFTGIRSAATGEASTSGFVVVETGDVTITCQDIVLPAGCDRNSPLRVTVTHDLHLIMGFVLPSPLRLSRSTEMLVP